MLNRVQLIGNLGADPEIRATQNGDQVVNLSVATSERWKDKQTGEKREITEWHRVVCFNQNLCEVMADYLKKGSKVFIEGQLRTRKWTDQAGTERYTTEVVMQHNATLTLLDSQRNGPPPADNPDNYGTAADYQAQSGR